MKKFLLVMALSLISAGLIYAEPIIVVEKGSVDNKAKISTTVTQEVTLKQLEMQKAQLVATLTKIETLIAQAKAAGVKDDSVVKSETQVKPEG